MSLFGLFGSSKGPRSSGDELKRRQRAARKGWRTRKEAARPGLLGRLLGAPDPTASAPKPVAGVTHTKVSARKHLAQRLGIDTREKTIHLGPPPKAPKAPRAAKPTPKVYERRVESAEAQAARKGTYVPRPSADQRPWAAPAQPKPPRAPKPPKASADDALTAKIARFEAGLMQGEELRDFLKNARTARNPSKGKKGQRSAAAPEAPPSIKRAQRLSRQFHGRGAGDVVVLDEDERQQPGKVLVPLGTLEAVKYAPLRGQRAASTWEHQFGDRGAGQPAATHKPLLAYDPEHPDRIHIVKNGSPARVSSKRGIVG